DGSPEVHPGAMDQVEPGRWAIETVARIEGMVTAIAFVSRPDGEPAVVIGEDPTRVWWATRSEGTWSVELIRDDDGCFSGAAQVDRNGDPVLALQGSSNLVLLRRSAQGAWQVERPEVDLPGCGPRFMWLGPDQETRLLATCGDGAVLATGSSGIWS